MPLPPSIPYSGPVQCDRCMEWVDGYIDETASSGFYVIHPGSYWEQFANVGEEVICDTCMWADERYVAVYGPHIVDALDHGIPDPSGKERGRNTTE